MPWNENSNRIKDRISHQSRPGNKCEISARIGVALGAEASDPHPRHNGRDDKDSFRHLHYVEAVGRRQENHNPNFNLRLCVSHVGPAENVF